MHCKRRFLSINHIRNHVNGEHFVKGAFLKTMTSHDIKPTSQACRQAFLPKVIVAFLDFSGIEWADNICCVFRVETPFSNFSGVV